MLAEDELRGVPLLVFANKQDVSGALGADAVSDALGLVGAEKGRQWSVRGACATKGEALEEGLDWYVPIFFSFLDFFLLSFSDFFFFDEGSAGDSEPSS